MIKYLFIILILGYGTAISGKSEQNLYSGSYALLVGIFDYTNGWKKLPGVKKDIELVSAELLNQRFKIEKVLNPTSLELEKVINEFINKYGHDINNRLLFYYAGHGNTMMTSYGEDMGYIVPVDSPNPEIDKNGFLYKSISMERFELYAKQIEAKHALFMFDACFAGSIFSISRGNVPTNIEYKLSKPVRQFITSGSASESVPDESIFRQQFIEGIQGSADINSDAYITASEMGEYLQEKVINYTKGTQHPQYGKIRNPRLDKGDFILVSHSISEPVKTPDENKENPLYNAIESKSISVVPFSFLNNEYLNFAPVVSGDGKTIYFVSNRPGSMLKQNGEPSTDIWAVKKSNRLDTVFSEPFAVTDLNTSEDEGPLSLAADNETVFFSSLSPRPDGLGNADIYQTSQEGDHFTKPRNLGATVNSKYWDSNPSITPGQDRLYFASTRPGPNGENNSDIWYSDWDSENEEWLPPRNLTEINTQGKECAPFIAADGVTLFFSSDGLKPNYGGLDFYVTRYNPDTHKFSKPENLGKPFNSSDDEMYIVLPASGDVVYLSSKRTDVLGIKSRWNILMLYLKDLQSTIIH